MIKTIYCELDFLREFVRNIPLPDLLGDDEKYLSWKKVYQLLKNNIVIFDRLLSEEELKELKAQKEFNVSSKALWTIVSVNFETSNSFQLLRENNFGHLSNDHLQSVFLMVINQRKKLEISQATGILLLGKSDIEKYDSLYSIRNISISAEESRFRDWSDLDFPESIRISNSLIIVDNYILKDTMKFEKNIYALLDVVLPFHTFVEYHISLFVEPKNFSESDIQLRYNKLVAKIQEIRPNLNFNLEIIDADNRFHDRKLITNNIYIRCGEGFDIFPVKKSTDVDIAFPFMDNSRFKSNKESYYTLIEELKSIEYNNKYGKHRWGENNVANRLLAQIKNNI